MDVTLQTDGWTPWTGDQPRRKAATYTGQLKHTRKADIRARVGFEPHNPSVREDEDISYIRPRGHCDWHSDNMNCLINHVFTGMGNKRPKAQSCPSYGICSYTCTVIIREMCCFIAERMLFVNTATGHSPIAFYIYIINAQPSGAPKNISFWKQPYTIIGQYTNKFSYLPHTQLKPLCRCVSNSELHACFL
jgi:hypothetical protein